MSQAIATPDVSKTEAFADRLVEIINGGSAALMISIGHRLGLFDQLATMTSASSEQLAAATRLQERYVREWLGAMTVARIVEFDPVTKTYRLPPEHAASLTRAAGADNMAGFTQYVAVLGSVEDRIVDCFRNGGGVPYSEFDRFHEVMAEDSGQSVLPALIDEILPLANDAPQLLGGGAIAADLGCGCGKALNLMAEHFPNSKFVGYDLCEEPLRMARAEAAERGLQNVTFEQCDAAGLDLENEFDLVCTFDAIHDQADPAGVLANIRRMLKPGGTYLMQDIRASRDLEKNIDHPIGTFLYTVSCMHCMTVSLAQNGCGLGTCWGEETAIKMLAEAGFADIRTETLPHDIQNNYYVSRKP